MQNSCAVTQSKSGPLFATLIVQFVYFLNAKFQNSSFFLRLYNLVCVRSCLKSRRRVFSIIVNEAVAVSMYNEISIVFFAVAFLFIAHGKQLKSCPNGLLS